jgi:phage tail protein X
MKATQYNTQVGDTWASIAAMAYGQPERFPEIIEANPNVPITATLPAGIVVWVPISASTTTTAKNLPPWK